MVQNVSFKYSKDGVSIASVHGLYGVYSYPLPCNGGFWVTFLIRWIRFLGSVNAASAEDRALQVQHVESK